MGLKSPASRTDMTRGIGRGLDCLLQPLSNPRSRFSFKKMKETSSPCLKYVYTYEMSSLLLEDMGKY